ncbi:phosphotransferase enzyme family protein [Rhizoctonia solani AG-3 Rhs1AP]|uniref:Phosphotransferase enzyme family protein n=2 Tax=Rhizoctonia solani AG-3 TaxID=1086053 RepID=A0A074RLC0_9AGAM|nr:phosphotransferase enzyme family protein [Rhizoctonia solani AG-3 Rhs1AP]KEP45538.1 phosphotransferase enzyme family protein [Rhizoctonia solani 123E]
MSSSPGHCHPDHSDRSSDVNSDVDSDVDSDVGSDADSETSTVEYSHEPFDTYQNRVRELLCVLYGSNAGRVAEISRLSGGGFNRIIGVTLLLDGHRKHFILRVPRFDNVNVSAQVCILRSLRPFFPVPEVESYDSGTDNSLEGPYILMHRLPGQSLYDILEELDIDERCDMAKQIAQLIAKIHSFALPPGVGPLYGDTEGNLRVGRSPTSPPWSEDKKIIEDLNDAGGRVLIPMTFSEFVTTRLAEFSADALRAGSGQEFKVKLYDQLLHASNILLRTFTLSDRIALFHRDLAPRNILVDRNGEGGSWTVTGVLDWDDCEAAPYEIAGVWPGWLWQSRGEVEMDFEENEWDPDIPVTNEESKRIKQVFVKEIEELEPGFQEMARRTRDNCLRQLYERARGGIWSTQHIKEVERVVAVAQGLTQADEAAKNMRSTTVEA